jgi:hypothetical protein
VISNAMAVLLDVKRVVGRLPVKVSATRALRACEFRGYWGKGCRFAAAIHLVQVLVIERL